MSRGERYYDDEPPEVDHENEFPGFTGSTTYVAPNKTNVLTGERIRICQLNFSPMSPPPDNEVSPNNGKSLLETYMDGATVDPLRNAYLLLFVTTYDGIRWEKPHMSKAIYARTNADGEMIRIHENEIDNDQIATWKGGASLPPDRWALFKPNSCVLYFWTLTKNHFKHVISEARNNVDEATKKHEFSGFHVFGSLLYNMGESQARFDREQLLKRMIFTKNPSAGYPTSLNPYDVPDIYLGEKILEMLPNSAVAKRFRYSFCGCNLINDLYAAELTYYKALTLIQQASNEFPLLEHMKNICHLTDISNTQERRKEMRGVVPKEQQIQDDLFLDTRYGEAFQAYAYNCAVNPGVSPKLFSRALNLTSDYSADSMDAANTIFADFGIKHPCSDERGELTKWEDRFKQMVTSRWAPDADGVVRLPTSFLDSSGVLRVADPWVAETNRAIKRYFDFYRFGTEHRGESIRVDNTQKIIKQKLLEIQKELSRFMAKNLPYDTFRCHLEAHDDVSLKDEKKLHERYLDLALNFKYPWWEHYDPPKEPFWEWIADFADKSGGLKNHFDKLENAQAYNEWMQGSTEKIEKFIYDLEKRSRGFRKGKSVKPTYIGSDLRVGVRWLNLVEAKVTIKSMGKEEFSATLIFMTNQARKRTGKVPYSNAMKNIPDFQIRRVPFQEIKVWPSWLSMFGDAISLAITLKNFTDDLKEKRYIDVFGRLGKDTAQLVDSLSSALNICSGESGLIRGFKKWGTVARVPGVLLEACFNVYDGYVILFDDEGLARAAYSEGKTIEAWVQEVNGLVLVSSVVPGTVAIGSAALGTGSAGIAIASGATTAEVLTAALGVMGFWLAIAAIVVVALGVGVYIFRESPSSMEPIEKAVKEAMRKEFGKDTSEFVISRSADSIDMLLQELRKVLNSA